MSHPNDNSSCNFYKGCTLSLPILIGAAAVIFLMILTILILSICLCRVCKKLKKRKLTEGMGEEEEANLHYAELQNLPVPNRGQCNGGRCEAAAALAVAQNSDYATVAELKAEEDGGCDQGPIEDNSGCGGVENQPPVEME
ncbi:hypothetical protein JRQ81_003522 [Phrynocephalus forsythii]|uniref:Leukocyte-specific transcript 1 protein n=1 Tax=Phrynocephalus forsythii TaxID=171643 RepID=A0A9Q0XKZ4_9SAUR|nr:hypothetical protein JRQ81_003522 [Phrynocephalus forsythii]